MRTFDSLYERIGIALRGDRPRVVAEILTTEGGNRIVYKDEDRQVH